MPPVPFEDGPACDDPKVVAKAWAAQPGAQQRANRCQRLVQGTDPNAKSVGPTRENMVKNHFILVEVARDMSYRDRSSADPIETIAEMVQEFYDQYPLYPQIHTDFDAKVWAFGDAWSTHKMISRLRNVVPKYTSVRDPGLLWQTFK